MCDPMTIIGIGLSVGSAAANAAAQSRVAKKRADVMAAERIRQRAYQQETDALNATSQNRYQGFEEKQGETSGKLADFFKGEGGTSAPAATPAMAEPSLVPASSSNIVNQAESKAVGAAKEYTNQQGEALGGLRSFGDLMGSIGRDQARDAGYIGQINGFMRGSSNVLPLELEEANGAGAGMGMLGDILGGLGKIGMSAGLGQGSPVAGAAGTAAAGSGVSNLPTFARAGGGVPKSSPLNLGLPSGSLPTFARGGFNPFNPYGGR